MTRRSRALLLPAVAWPFLLGCQSDGAAAAPVGFLEQVTSTGPGEIRVVGWAADAGLPEGPLQVEIYIDGELAGEITADKHRPDTALALPGYGDHLGFDSILTVATTGAVTVCANAVNAGSGSTNTLLGCLTVDPDAPFGRVDDVRSAGTGEIYVRGWAADPDLPEGPLRVEVHADGESAGELTADKFRHDVPLLFPDYGDHLGFDATLRVAGTGMVTVCITAINEGPGTDTELGCSTVEVS